MQEETKEYLQDNNVEELVDIIEVVYAILNSMNVSVEDFESVRKAKVETRGAFKERVYLEEAE